VGFGVVGWPAFMPVRPSKTVGVPGDWRLMPANADGDPAERGFSVNSWSLQ
jgi:hypothetical protein